MTQVPFLPVYTALHYVYMPIHMPIPTPTPLHYAYMRYLTFSLTVYRMMVRLWTGGFIQRAWVDSSPSNGLISTQPYTKRWGATSTSTSGDMHFYSYDCDCEDPSSYPPARFVSEFGFQSWPSFSSLAEVSLPDDWHVDSAFLQFRQRHEGGNAEMLHQMDRHFDVPTSFENYLYLSGVQQARCYETAINKWRFTRHTDGADDVNGATMGILFWQLNDVWPGASWSAMEYGGRWKPLMSTGTNT